MKDSMRTIYRMDKVNIYGVVVICIRVSGWMDSFMVEEYWLFKMVPYMKVSGSMENDRDLVNREINII